MKIRAWDTETRTFALAGRKASPYYPGNWIVVQGWVDCEVDRDFKPLTSTPGPGGVPYPYTKPKRIYHGAERPPDGFLSKILDGVDILVGANIRFDLQHCLVGYPENRRIYREWVKQGGRIWDILHAEYVLRGAHEGVQWASLDSVAPKYGGRVKEDQVKAMWAQDIDTLDIPLLVLDPYLIGAHDPEYPEYHYHPGDVGNTMLAFLGQMSLKQRPSMMKVLQLDMLAIQCAAEMEMNGIYMDLELAEELRLDAKAKLEEAATAFLALIPEEHRPFVNPTSRIFKSAVLYGGTVTYTRKGFLSVGGETQWEQWPDGQQAYPKKTVKQPLFNEDGSPLLFKSGRNAGQQKTKNIEVPDTDKPPKTKNIEVTFTLPRRVTPPETEEQGEDGAWSTSKKVLDQIVEKDEALNLIRDLSLWAKDVATSYWVEDAKGNRKGLMTLVGEDGLVHPNFRTNTTATQRFSCDSPNAQQISKKSRIKESFKSRWGCDGFIGQADFTSLESYSVALLTGDEAMLRDLNDPDFDMHCSAVAFFKGVTVPEAIKLCKGDNAVKEWKDLRQAMKGCNFAYEYGSGLKTLALTGDLTIEEAQKFVEFREQLYPTAVQFKKALHQAVVRSIRYTGEMKRSAANPAYPFREGFGLWRAPTGRVWAFETDLSHPEQYKKGITETVAPTHTGNYPFQGTGCDWMKAVMALAFLLECRGAWQGALMIATVHDAFYVDSPEKDRENTCKLMSYCLDAANDVMATLGLDMKARVPYTLGTGSSWAEEKAAPLDQYEPDFDVIQSIFEYKQ